MASPTKFCNSIKLTSVPSTPLSAFHVHRTHRLTHMPNFLLHFDQKRTLQRTHIANPRQQQLLSHEQSTMLLDVTVEVTVQSNKGKGGIKEIISRTLAAITDQGKGHVILQLLSRDLDPETMKPKMSKKAILQWSKDTGRSDVDMTTYTVDLKVEPNFGMPGAISVSNHYEDEFFLASISVQGIVQFGCRSWIQPAKLNSQTRIFFSNKAYLPSQTPVGLIELRERELKYKQGDGKGLRLPSDRIYDYDVYNDLGDPDRGIDYVRPTLGGETNPHPRRCRTGRPPPTSDRKAEIPSNESYVPRDEEYEQPKKEFMSREKIKEIIRSAIPVLIAKMFGETTLYTAVHDPENRSGNSLKIMSLDEKLNHNLLLICFIKMNELLVRIFKLDPPKYISKDMTWGLLDDECGRRVLAGLNPGSIEKLKVFPPVSKLDPSIHGSQESALKEQHILQHLEGLSVQQALDEDKLFILDYHDMYLPIVEGINATEGRKVYATRTIFFLSPLGTLTPIAIELSLPSAKEVLTPPTDITTYWLWQLAKEHVCSNDAAIHTLVNHWLRIHACIEPFSISAHRNLSVMHPIFKLLDPHMRYLIKTNAYSRDNLINAGSFIESFNSPEKYCMQLSCAAYRGWWRFDQEGLPADLIRRGMAVPDPTKPNGLRLTIEDYPYAQDGLLIWSAIKKLVKEYVTYYYPKAELLKNDTELQCWYSEAINSGHADVRDATWWPKLSTPDDLINILTTIIWTVTGQHAIVNFGQYSYGAYVQARPSFMRRLLPSKHDDPDYEHFVANPEEYFLSSIPSFTQAGLIAAVLDVASAHSPDEEYIGQRKDLSSWSSDPQILEAFYQFYLDIKTIEHEIEKRNSDPRLRNRCGPGIFPFQLLIPGSGPGNTNRGVPNSVTA